MRPRCGGRHDRSAPHWAARRSSLLPQHPDTDRRCANWPVKAVRHGIAVRADGSRTPGSGRADGPAHQDFMVDSLWFPTGRCWRVRRSQPASSACSSLAEQALVPLRRWPARQASNPKLLHTSSMSIGTAAIGADRGVAALRSHRDGLARSPRRGRACSPRRDGQSAHAFQHPGPGPSLSTVAAGTATTRSNRSSSRITCATKSFTGVSRCGRSVLCLEPTRGQP